MVVAGSEQWQWCPPPHSAQLGTDNVFMEHIIYTECEKK